MILSRPISHIGYAVADIESAVKTWSLTLGAGPFFFLSNIQFEEVTSEGQPAEFAHSSAFGQWGSVALELMQFEKTSPSIVTEKLHRGPLSRVNHVAYISATPEEDSDKLQAAGYKQFLHARDGEMEIRFHDTVAALGHSIEIHRECDFVVNNFIRIAEAAIRWDGSRLLRPMSDLF